MAVIARSPIVDGKQRSVLGAPARMDFDQIVELIYDAVIDRTLWPTLLEQICAFVGGDAGTIHVPTKVS